MNGQKNKGFPPRRDLGGVAPWRHSGRKEANGDTVGAMAVFSDRAGEDSGGLDWHLLQNGPIVLYFRREILDADLAWLREHRYDVRSFDCLEWSDEQSMHESFASTLHFPDYYGKNVDALNDSLPVRPAGSRSHAARLGPDTLLHVGTPASLSTHSGGTLTEKL